MTAAFYPQIEGSCDRVCVCYFHKEKNGTLLKCHVPREHLDFFRCVRDCCFILQCGVFGASPAPHPGTTRRRIFKPALPASHHQFVVATSGSNLASQCWVPWSSVLYLILLSVLSSYQILLLSVLVRIAPTTTVRYQTKDFHTDPIFTWLPFCVSPLLWDWISSFTVLTLLDTLRDTYPRIHHLQSASKHGSTYSPLVILSPSCPVTSLSSVAELPVTLLSVHSPCFSVSPLSTFLGCRSPV